MPSQARNEAFAPERTVKPASSSTTGDNAPSVRVQELPRGMEKERRRSTTQCRSCCVNFLGSFAKCTEAHFKVRLDCRNSYRAGERDSESPITSIGGYDSHADISLKRNNPDGHDHHLRLVLYRFRLRQVVPCPELLPVNDCRHIP